MLIERGASYETLAESKIIFFYLSMSKHFFL
jgi:hypothetical protein